MNTLPKMTPAQRQAAYRKGLETRRRNKALIDAQASQALARAMDAEALAKAKRAMRRKPKPLGFWARLWRWFQ